MKSRFLPHLPYLTVILLLVLGLRIIPYYSSTFTADGPVITDPDGVYHLRRVELIVQDFPHIPLFDSYINHPNGAYIIWPPLYDLLLAILWSILNLFSGLSSPLVVLVFLPPLFMFLTCVVIYRTGLRLWPKKRWLAGLAHSPCLT